MMDGGVEEGVFKREGGGEVVEKEDGRSLEWRASLYKA